MNQADLCRSALICPANRPDLIAKLDRVPSDVVIVDLEDGTPEQDKVRSRDTAVHGLDALKSSGCSSLMMIRTNAPESQHIDGDLAAAVASGVDGVVIPKVASVADVHRVERTLFLLERQSRRPPLALILGIESVAGVVQVVDVATSSTRAVALYFGAEDYITDLGGRRTRPALEVIHARSTVAMAARLAGLGALDYATLEVHDDDRLREEAQAGKDLGYTGRICLHPRQVELAHEVYSPSVQEIERSERLLQTYRTSLEKGEAVCIFDDQMIDGPLVKRAENILAAARGMKTRE